jgi:hypothetical protein
MPTALIIFPTMPGGLGAGASAASPSSAMIAIPDAKKFAGQNVSKFCTMALRSEISDTVQEVTEKTEMERRQSAGFLALP